MTDSFNQMKHTTKADLILAHRRPTKWHQKTYVKQNFSKRSFDSPKGEKHSKVFSAYFTNLNFMVDFVKGDCVFLEDPQDGTTKLILGQSW